MTFAGLILFVLGVMAVFIVVRSWVESDRERARLRAEIEAERRHEQERKAAHRRNLTQATAARKATEDAKRLERQQLKAAGPPAKLGTWRIDYRDIEGTVTRRTVRLLKLMPRNRQLEAWCELRGDKRTFWIDSIIEAVDLATGEILDMDEWIGQQAAERKRQRASSATWPPDV